MSDIPQSLPGSDHDDPTRRRLLKRLRADLAALRVALGNVRDQTQALLDLETTRPLTAGEASRARALARESERLRWELRRLREEFSPLQSYPGGAGGPKAGER